MIGKFKFVLTHPSVAQPEVIWEKTIEDAFLEFQKRHTHITDEKTIVGYTNKDWLKSQKVSKRKKKVAEPATTPAEEVNAEL